MAMDTAQTDRGITIYYDIPYVDPDSGHAHQRHFGDVFVPQQADGAPLALIIHGGGWNAMDKNSFAGVAEFFAEQGYVAYAINYRLIKHAPYPACYSDCMRAAAFLAGTDHPIISKCKREQIVVCGGSAGGHLALMTGLTCQIPNIAGIVSIAGPTDLAIQLSKGKFKEIDFFGNGEKTDEQIQSASPLSHVNEQSPPLLCTHSEIDELVVIQQAEALIAAYHEHGRDSTLHRYVGNDKFHGIWPAGFAGPVDGPDGRLSSNLKHLHPELEEVIGTFIQRFV